MIKDSLQYFLLLEAENHRETWTPALLVIFTRTLMLDSDTVRFNTRPCTTCACNNLVINGHHDYSMTTIIIILCLYTAKMCDDMQELTYMFFHHSSLNPMPLFLIASLTNLIVCLFHIILALLSLPAPSHSLQFNIIIFITLAG